MLSDGASMAVLRRGGCERLSRFLRALDRSESGSTAIITAIALTLVVGIGALATEVGLWYAERRALQTAADAAALGAAYQIYRDGTDSDNIVPEGEKSAARNGFTNGQGGITLTVSNPPTTGDNSSNEYAAEAIIEQAQPTMLASFFLNGDVNIKARAVAVVKVGGPFCILALDPSASASLKFGGTTDLNLENCGMIVNSSSGSAMSLIGASVVGATYADIYGGYTKSTNSTLDLEEGTPNTGIDPLPDPFKDLDIPPTGGCTYTNFQTSNTNTAWGGQPQPLTPGHYCGGLRVRNKAHMAAGNYIIDGGTFKVVSGAVLTSDPGVTIFLTGGASNYAQADIAGGATVSIIAPTTGTYKGIAFFQDRNAPGVGSVSPNMFNGGSTMEIKGAIYIPNQKVEFSGGNTSAGGCTKIVAFQIEFTGNSDIDSDCTGYGFDDETRRPPKLEE